MKKISFLLIFIGLFLLINSNQSFALIPQADTTTTTAAPDDLDFTTVGSTEDSIKNSEVKIDKKDTVITAPISTGNKTNSTDSLWTIFIAGLIGGFIAFFLPCIYPMVPLTVSFFTKRAETKGKGIRGAIIYGLSIIVIYVILGVIITLIFGAGALNELATDGIFNIFIFLILLVFGISFLGAFEITLPSSFVNKIDSKSDSKGLGGIFFMAATLAVVSFSCTGPVIGSVLVAVSQTGDYLAPIMAMFGFSLALAMIFTVFAIFPSWLTSLPKSGGWLNAVKVVLGFLEIALSLKFLSMADTVYGWRILDREVFLVIWIAIGILLTLYLLGKIKLSHDSEMKFLSIPRLFLAATFLSFTLYLIPGLWGAPLKLISGLAPPFHTQDFVLTEGSGTKKTETSGQTKKYSDLFKMPHQIDGFFDYDEGLAYAKKMNKPMLLDFTGLVCVNCREMEENVWSDPRVLKILKEDYIVISLYTDSKTELPEEERFESKILETTVNSVGKKFKHFQAEHFQTISQPYYVLWDINGTELVSPPIGVEFNIDKYIAYLNKGLAEYKKRND